MGQTFIIHMDVAGHRITDTSWNWGIIPDGQARSSDPSYGRELKYLPLLSYLTWLLPGPYQPRRPGTA
ncbi:hypothetical protein [Streptomyces microflavus]|uniref:hypothetical protein n=1 Tax=Streptomyces microflavus TaxID=1919 RepID=UPI003B228F35